MSNKQIEDILSNLYNSGWIEGSNYKENNPEHSKIPSDREVKKITAALQALSKLLLDREKEVAKAYGGCTNCYGKGYSTTIEYAQSFPDFIGDKGYKTQKPIIKFCECERGNALQHQLKEGR